MTNKQRIILQGVTAIMDSLPLNLGFFGGLITEKVHDTISKLTPSEVEKVGIILRDTVERFDNAR